MGSIRRVVPWLVLAGGILALEGGARLLAGPPEYFQGHPFVPDLGFAAIPGAHFELCDPRGSYPWTLNSSGFRGPDLPAAGSEPAGEELDILFVGDSFLAGWDVREESLLPAATQSALKARGIAARSFNVSCSGYGTAQELLLLRKYGERVRPRFVVLCLYSGNDVVDNSLELSGRTTVSNGAWVRPYYVLDEHGELRATSLHPGIAALRRFSRLATLLDHRLFQLRYRKLGQYVEDGFTIDPQQRLRQRLLPNKALEVLCAPQEDGEWERAWRTTEVLLGMFDQEARALGAELLVAVLPHAFQVEAGALFRQSDDIVRSAGMAPLDVALDFNLPERRLGECFRAAGIQHALLLDALRQDLQTSGSSGYLYDGHFNSRAHELAGAVVAEHLARMSGAEPLPPDPLPAGRPVDLLGELWRGSADFRFIEPIKDLLGYGWKKWGCDWYGAGPGWVMSEDAWLVLPSAHRRFVLQAFLPAEAPLPVTFRVSGRSRALGAPVEVSASGPFELVIDLGPTRDDAAWVPVQIRAARPFPSPWFGKVGLVMHALRAEG